MATVNKPSGEDLRGLQASAALMRRVRKNAALQGWFLVVAGFGGVLSAGWMVDGIRQGMSLWDTCVASLGTVGVIWTSWLFWRTGRAILRVAWQMESTQRRLDAYIEGRADDMLYEIMLRVHGRL